jgi:hypothetical protein
VAGAAAVSDQRLVDIRSLEGRSLMAQEAGLVAFGGQHRSVSRAVRIVAFRAVAGLQRLMHHLGGYLRRDLRVAGSAEVGAVRLQEQLAEDSVRLVTAPTLFSLERFVRMGGGNLLGHLLVAVQAVLLLEPIG